MAKGMFKGKLYIDGYDVSTDHQALDMVFSKAELDTTPIDLTAHRRIGGVRDWQLTHSGFNEQGTGKIDPLLNAWQAGTAAKAVTFCPATGVYDDPAYSGSGLHFNYSIGGKVGDVQPFAGAMFGHDVNAFRGTIMATGEKTADGTGTIKQLGAVSTTQKLYAVLHVTAVTAAAENSLAVKVQSASLQAFGSPTNRIAFAAVTTAVTGEYATPIAGEITDTWWRVTWTVTGPGSYSYTIHVNVGIQGG
jgi:hypothetical protein